MSSFYYYSFFLLLIIFIIFRVIRKKFGIAPTGPLQYGDNDKIDIVLNRNNRVQTVNYRNRNLRVQNSEDQVKIEILENFLSRLQINVIQTNADNQIISSNNVRIYFDLKNYSTSEIFIECTQNDQQTDDEVFMVSPTGRMTIVYDPTRKLFFR